MIGIQECASRSESNRSVHLYKLASQQATKALIRLRIMDHNAAHFKFEPEHDKTNKTTCARTEDSGQSGHPPSPIRVFIWAVWVANDLNFCQLDSEDSGQTGHRSFCCLVLRIILLLKQSLYSWLQAQNFASFEHCCLWISLLNEYNVIG